VTDLHWYSVPEIVALTIDVALSTLRGLRPTVAPGGGEAPL
jgi:hypothetical protein